MKVRHPSAAASSGRKLIQLLVGLLLLNASAVVTTAADDDRLGPGVTVAIFEGVVPEDWPVGVATPVSLPLSHQLVSMGPDACVATIRLDRGKETTVRAQFERPDADGHAPGQLWFIWSAPEEAPGKSIRVQVQRVNKRVDPHTLPLNSMYYPPHLKMKNQDGQVVLAYWHGNPDSKNPKNYPLNNYIYPLLGLDGETLIAESPHDHIHHRGIFWAWVRNERVGEWHGDWWIPKGITCDPEQLTFADGHVFSRFAAKHTWIYQKSKGGQKDRFMTEYAVCRIFNPDKDTRLVDVDVMLKARGEGVRIGGQTAADKGYSGLTVRFGNAEKVRIETDEQLIEKSSLNQVTAKWIDWTGFFHAPDSKERLPHRSGAAVMVHPSHPDFPPEWITRYYGPINVAWPGLKMQKIPQDKPVILRYRLHVHRGTAKEAGVNQQYQAYAADWKWVQKPLR